MSLAPVYSISNSRVLPVSHEGEVISRVDDRRARELLKARKVVPIWSDRSITGLALIDTDEPVSPAMTGTTPPCINGLRWPTRFGYPMRPSSQSIQTVWQLPVTRRRNVLTLPERVTYDLLCAA